MRVVLTLFASLCLSATAALALPQAQPAAGASFTDISGSIYEDDIEWAVSEGITSGCTSTRYCPDNPVTRGQMAAFIARMFDLPATTNDYFSDDDDSTYETSINRVTRAGIASGCTTTRYCPTRVVTRAEMTTFLARAADLAQGGVNNYFYDDNGTTHEISTNRAAFAGIATGCAQWQFCPRNGVTRGQMAAFLHRVVEPVPAPPYPAPPPPPPPFSFGDGTYVVGSGVPAGIYRSLGGTPCYWERPSGFGGTLDKIIANDFDDTHLVVEIKLSDEGFSSDGCGTWTNNLSAITSSKTAPFGEGTYIVGVDIGSGTWTAPGGSSCYWESLSGFGGELADIIANDFGSTSPIVAISAGDEGFKSSNCGTWTRSS